MKKFFVSEQEASAVVADMIPSIITIVIAAILLIFYSTWVYNFESREYINSIVREYVLRMETRGCLTKEDKDMLFAELQNKGMEQICLDGTTLTPVENGDIVTLKISGEIKYKQFSFKDIFKWGEEGNNKKHIEVIQSTTAIY